MAYDEYIVERIRNILLEKKVDFFEKKMFGGLTFMVDDKMCIGAHNDRVMARIGPDVYEEALKKEGCKQMGFTGKGMIGFVFVDAEAVDMEEDLEYWVQLCLDYNPLAKASKKRRK